MYIEVSEHRIELTPQSKDEEAILRSADVIDEDKYLVFWGDTEPYGKMKQGVIICHGEQSNKRNRSGKSG